MNQNIFFSIKKLSYKNVVTEFVRLWKGILFIAYLTGDHVTSTSAILDIFWKQTEPSPWVTNQPISLFCLQIWLENVCPPQDYTGFPRYWENQEFENNSIPIGKRPRIWKNPRKTSFWGDKWIDLSWIESQSSSYTCSQSRLVGWISDVKSAKQLFRSRWSRLITVIGNAQHTLNGWSSTLPQKLNKMVATNARDAIGTSTSMFSGHLPLIFLIKIIPGDWQHTGLCVSIFLW